MANYVLVSICCNSPDNGELIGRLCGVDYNGMDLAHTGGSCKISFPRPSVVRISRRTFQFRTQREWVGNWCWNALAMTRREAHRLVAYLRSQPDWVCEGGPARLCDWYDRRSLPQSKSAKA